MRSSGKHLDPYRKEHPTMGASPAGALYGYFRVKVHGVMHEVISSGEAHGSGDLECWEHVSVSTRHRNTLTPSWSAMGAIKDLFWAPDECVLQFHPPEDEYVNYHSGCLHLWKPPYTVQTPPTAAIGPVTGSGRKR